MADRKLELEPGSSVYAFCMKKTLPLLSFENLPSSFDFKRKRDIGPVGNEWPGHLPAVCI